MIDEYGDVEVFVGVVKFLVRIKCVIFFWKVMERVIFEKEGIK